MKFVVVDVVWQSTRCRLYPASHQLFQNTRLKSSKAHGSKSKRYANSLNLPRTSMPLTMKDGAAAQREAEIRKTTAFKTLYKWQREQDWNKSFILHDGPPYANGKTHVGHVVNKVLKDITNRFKVLTNHRVHYIPGWDCHGMPIELKAITDKEGQHQKLPPLELRTKAKKFAKDVIKEQGSAFQSWGVMGDWENPYKTLSPLFESTQLEIFYKIFEKGYMYRDYMPVYWSPSSQTALAEAELEYNPSHVSKSLYVKFPLTSLTSNVMNHIDSSATVYAVIWTTTPWTLPFNQAICFNSSIRYCLLKDNVDQCYYLCEEGFVENMMSMSHNDVEIIQNFEGSCLQGAMYRNPLNDKELPILHGNHVMSGKGTGLVHTAPAHGHDDFAVALKYNLPKECHVDGEGRLCSGVDDALLGKIVGVDAENTVIDLLSPWLLKVEDFTHSYPYDWRTKKPVFIRASEQWFINTSMLKEKALESLSQVEIIPLQSERGLLSEIKSRPYWCISRQRTWGVPIPVFYHKESGATLITKETVKHLCCLIKEHGSDCWWQLPTSDLLPDELLQKLNKGRSSDYVKGEDILDIWFDSGVTWASVLNEYDGQADVYLEGVDQFKGWFQTSLLTSVAVRGHAPYKKIITHGFATDEDGKKMSKSIGNVVDPEEVIHGGKDKKSLPSYGVDVLRWWVAHSHQHQQIMIGPSILKQLNEDVFKIRKCIRHMVGCLDDFNPQSDMVEYKDMTVIDKYILHILYTMIQQISEAYEHVNYSKVVQHIEKFVYADLSSFYISNTKDRCYCDQRGCVNRRSTQTVLYHLTKALTTAFAPIMPHLAQEIHQHTPDVGKDGSKMDSVFKDGLYEMQPEWNNPGILDTLTPVFDMRRDLMEEIGMENPVEFDIMIYCSPKLQQVLQEIQPEMTSSSSSLCEIFQTSYVTILDKPPTAIPEDVSIIEGTSVLPYNDDSSSYSNEVDYKVLITTALQNICERCRRYTAQTSNSPCSRCLDALASEWSA